MPEIAETAEIVLVNRQLATYDVRRDTLYGEPHIVVPVIMMVPGIHRGSGGAVRWTANELSKYAQAWNGEPVTVQHPADADGNPVSVNKTPQIAEEYTTGVLYNVRFQNNKLKGEAWINEALAQEKFPAVLEHINTKRPLEVSTGMFNDVDGVEGNENGEVFDNTAYNIRPDHLALLPGGEGACNWMAGCGIRNNESNKSQEGGDKDMAEDIQNEEQEEKIHPAVVNINKGYREVMNALSAKFDSMDNSQYMHYLEEVDDKFVIYTVRPNTPSANGPEIYKRGYTFKDGEITLGEKAIPVRKNVTYKEITSNEGGKEMTDKVESCCPEKVELLIENEETQWTEDDRDFLLTFNEAQLEKITPVEKEEKLTDNETEDKEEMKEEIKPVTFEEILANADDATRESIQEGKRLVAEKRDALIAGITANEQNTYTKEELMEMKMPMLEKMAKLAKVPAFIGNAGDRTTANHGDEIAPMEEVTLKEEK